MPVESGGGMKGMLQGGLAGFGAGMSSGATSMAGGMGGGYMPMMQQAPMFQQQQQRVPMQAPSLSFQAPQFGQSLFAGGRSYSLG